jgi:hypothetical protein
MYTWETILGTFTPIRTADRDGRESIDSYRCRRYRDNQCSQSTTYNYPHPKLLWRKAYVILPTQHESWCTSLHLGVIQSGAWFSVYVEEELRAKGFDSQHPG